MGRLVSAMPGKSPLSHSARGRLPAGKEVGRNDAKSPQSVPSLPSMESKEKCCDPFKKHSEGVGGKVPSLFERGEILLDDSPSLPPG